ncbi:hypothetical protein [Undibacterium aquatile]|uniref:Uncharacterized protein n=1 Tax=Undibacterium aquatile TaxID=1537398 RepID=A0ABR6XGA0_9BURK|nr:hypothetical protein [Undibacterium aquatile]MBC3811319.1 hypothetical protein [Undibacterium aquatile]
MPAALLTVGCFFVPKGEAMQDDFGNEVHPQTIQELRLRMDTIQQQLDANTESTRRTESNTSELIDILNSFKSAFKVLTWIGRLAKPITAILSFFLTVWGIIVAIKMGMNPK